MLFLSLLTVLISEAQGANKAIQSIEELASRLNSKDKERLLRAAAQHAQENTQVAGIKPELAYFRAEFEAYKKHIDEKIASQPVRGKICCMRRYDRRRDGDPVAPFGWVYLTAKHDCEAETGGRLVRAIWPQGRPKVDMPWTGEYGNELTTIAPWFYATGKQLDCDLYTLSMPGTKYLYYFSRNHTVDYQLHRVPTPYAPVGCPLKNTHMFPHFDPKQPASRTGDEKLQEGMWEPPPYPEFFKTGSLRIHQKGDTRPLLILVNKHTEQWHQPPVNFIPIDTIRELLTMLTPLYKVIYNRMEAKALEDTNAPVGFADKQMIRTEFPGVLLMEDLLKAMGPIGLDSESFNLLYFGLCARTKYFVSVQGGNSAAVSMFSQAENLVLAIQGQEIQLMGGERDPNITKRGQLWGHDYQWYNFFQGGTLWHTTKADGLLRKVRERYAPEAVNPLSAERTEALVRCCHVARGEVNREHIYEKCEKQCK